ncbi:hypothetical protein CAEBREN_14103 [Caenorhabditis brenneri]|uniref:Uncharacterized protein n=1 Tax=Caenorhabditis brenneri TaxID=135651 RepID=G0P2C8_CAEBE|nr:hypothetical protein CAEBREN_14103 [Caenorhabditis brenneri]
MQHDNKRSQISPTIRRHSSNVKTYDAIQFRDKLRRGVSLENIGPHRVCFYPQPAPSHRNPPVNRPVLFAKNPAGGASKNISRKVSSYSKMSSLARVAWQTVQRKSECSFVLKMKIQLHRETENCDSSQFFIFKVTLCLWYIRKNAFLDAPVLAVMGKKTFMIL